MYHYSVNERDGLSNHQPYDCLLTRLFRRISKKTLKLLVTGLCEGNSQVIGEFPAQRTSIAENVFIWWRHDDFNQACHRIFEIKTTKKADNITRDHDGKMLSVVWRAEAICAGERATTMEEETVLYQSCRQYTALKQKNSEYINKDVYNRQRKASGRNNKPNL